MNRFLIGLLVVITAFLLLFYNILQNRTLNASETLNPAQSGVLPSKDYIVALIGDKAKLQGVSKETMLRIARCESFYRQFDKNGAILKGLDNPKDIGIFQLNEKYWLEPAKLIGFDIYTVEGNVDMAMWIAKNVGVKSWEWSKWCWVN